MYMSEPPKASWNKLCRDARHVGSSKDLGVRDSVLPFDLQEAPKAMEMEPVERLLLACVFGPRQATVQE